MAQVNSNQFANVIATPITKLRPDEKGGRQRVLYWDYTTTATTGEVAGTVLAIGFLPRNSRVIRATITVPASFLNTVATIGYGVSINGTVTVIDADRWGTFPALTSVGEYAAVPLVADQGYRTLALTSTTDANYLSYQEAAVCITFVTTDTGASKAICGTVTYVID